MIATALAEWAVHAEPGEDELPLASRSLQDTVAVTIAARDDAIRRSAAVFEEAGRWAVLAHVLDFDDLHLPSTTHVSAVCVPAALACGGGAREYLAAAGVMARIGIGLGWEHYAAGWHATTTAGPFGAATAAALAMGLGVDGVTTALALCVPAAGGVQRAFGTQAKSLQVGQAVDSGVRAARLAASGARADPEAVDVWMRLVRGLPERVPGAGPAVPGGLAVKLFPACYAVQRPIVAVRGALGGAVPAAEIAHVRVTTPRGTVTPLIHHRPADGLEGKFSLEYAVATAVLDDRHGFAAFSDAAVQRHDARRLVARVETELIEGGDGLLDGEVIVEIALSSGDVRSARVGLPPGAPGGPDGSALFASKLADCLGDSGIAAASITWEHSAAILRGVLYDR